MSIIGTSKRRRKKAELSLNVSVSKARNLILAEKFDCNFVCLVTSNLYYNRRSSKLKNSDTRWSETLKIHLPAAPSSEWVRVILYDVLPTTSPHEEIHSASPKKSNAHNHNSSGYNSPYSASSRSSTADVTTSSSTSVARQRRSSESSAKWANYTGRNQESRYLYVGEVRLSLLDLFKDNSTNSYQFHIEPKWYELFDRKRQRLQRSSPNDPSYKVGEIRLGFRLNCSSNKRNSNNTLPAYLGWRSRLLTKLDTKKSIKLVQQNVDGESKSKNSNEDIYMGSTEAISNEDIHEAEEDEHDAVFDGDDDVLSRIIGNYGSSRDLPLFDESEQGQDNTQSAAFDLQSMVTALDEYDVVDRSDVEDLDTIYDAAIGNSVQNVDIEDDELQEIEDDYDLDIEEGNDEEAKQKLELDDQDYQTIKKSYKEEEDEKEEEADTITINNSRPGIFRLRSRGKSYKFYATRINHKTSANYTLVKRQHATGVIFIEFKSIENLPPLINKMYRKYVMDPFIIAIFGRRVYKTSWRKHTLNPVFNDCAAFEVFPHETHFGCHFKIMDKDSFSNNDRIAHCNLSWSDIMRKQNPDHNWVSYTLPLDLAVKTWESDYSGTPLLHLDIRFIPYESLKKFFWGNAVKMSTLIENFDIVQLIMYLDKLGSFNSTEALNFFYHFGARPWSGETLTEDQLVEMLQAWKTVAGFKNIWKCPRCLRSYKSTRSFINSKLTLENDLITHFAVCTYSRNCKLLKPSYVSSASASRRWFSKILIKLTYGKYAVGSNNANILVQDRDTGIIIEEKMSAHVRLGMRIIYNGKSPGSKNFKILLKTLSVRQGKKFDSPGSVKHIEPFIKFHSLDMSQCLETEYKTFNEFFHRQLKPGSRVPEGENGKIFVSPADSRSIHFTHIDDSRRIWVKGSSFSICKLANNYEPQFFNDSTCSISIFRLAPQDYHRFHSPVDGIVGKPMFIDGEYYTVNPMAIRSTLDVFGENIRVVIPIISTEFGTILLIAVGAMMVGSIILTCQEGDSLCRGDEMGYFKFGGSTIITLVRRDKIQFDEDLLKNSNERIETLVKVGSSVGHSPDAAEFRRASVAVRDRSHYQSIKNSISVSDEHAAALDNVPWQYHALQRFVTQEFPEIDLDSEDPESTPLLDSSTGNTPTSSSSMLGQ